MVTYLIAKDWDVPTIIKNLTEVGMDAVELRTTHKHGVEIALSPAARALKSGSAFDGSAVKILWPLQRRARTTRLTLPS